MAYLSSSVKFTLFYLQIIILEIVSPYVIFLTLEPYLGAVISTLLTPLPVLLSIIITLILHRIIEPLSVLFFGICVFGALLTYLLNDPLYCQVSISILYIAIGLAFLITEYYTPKSLSFYFGRPWFTKGQNELNVIWNTRFTKNPSFRHQLRVNSWAWAFGFFLLGGISILLCFTLDFNLAMMLILALTFLQLIVNGGFSWFYSRYYEEIEVEKVEFAKV
jgi:intracellular septation protein A